MTGTFCFNPIWPFVKGKKNLSVPIFKHVNPAPVSVTQLNRSGGSLSTLRLVPPSPEGLSNNLPFILT